jgi:hypothetical protein
LFETEPRKFYIILGASIIAASFFSGFLTITHSVVINMPATEAAYSNARRLTLTGSMMPVSSRFSNFSVLAAYRSRIGGLAGKGPRFITILFITLTAGV